MEIILFLILCYIAPSLCVAISNATAPTVDLGYETYSGYYNSTADLNIFKGCVLTVSSGIIGVIT